MWISNETKICGGEVENCDYYIDTTNQSLAWDNVYASIKVNVIGDFEKKSYATDENCFEYSINYDGKNYKRMSLETADLLDISNDPDKMAICTNYFSGVTNYQPGTAEYANFYSLVQLVCSGQEIEVNGTNYDFHTLLYSFQSIGNVFDYEYLQREGIITNYQDNGSLYTETTTNEQITSVDKSQANIVIEHYRDYRKSCSSSSNLIIPREIDGISVTTIAPGVFEFKQLTSVEIPNSMITIGSGAFSGNQLTSVEIPNSVTTIGETAFLNNQLTTVKIGSGIQYIDSGAFRANRNLENITFTSKTCSEIKNIQATSTDTTKYFPWLFENSPYYQEGYKAKIIGTDGECSY